jgi:hypothetical protein
MAASRREEKRGSRLIHRNQSDYTPWECNPAPELEGYLSGEHALLAQHQLPGGIPYHPYRDWLHVGKIPATNRCS